MKTIFKNQGFTIIELMVAMMVLAFGILGFMFMQGRAIQGRTFSREMSRATIVAQNQIEDLRLLDLNDSHLSTGSHPNVSTNMNGFIYKTSWVVTGTSKMRSIIVTTQWQIKDPVLGMQTKSISLTTMVWEL